MADTTYPKVFFSLLERLAPRIVNSAEEEGTLDPTEWTTIPPQEKAAEEEQFPKIFSNVNVPAVVIHNPAERAQLGSAWVELNLAVEGLQLEPIPAPAEP